MNILIFIVILLVLVLVHEFGHFMAAKLFGIRVDEFGFGFPPRIFGKKRGETIYSFNAIPFGGFVKIFGENPDKESISGPDKERSLVNKPKRVQALVMVAGVLLNFILAYLLITATLFVGLPTVADSGDLTKIKNPYLMITSVMENSPAEKVGLGVGDKILSLNANGENLKELTPEGVQFFVNKFSDEDLSLTYQRKGKTETIITKAEQNLINGNPGIGISMGIIGFKKYSFLNSFVQGAKLTGQITYDMTKALFGFLKNIFIGQADFSTVTGPVGIVGMVGDAYSFGFAYLLYFISLISINLAIINLIPFPALDGGRLFFLLIEKIKGSPINPKVANIVNAIGFFALIILMIAVTYQDIVKIF